MLKSGWLNNCNDDIEPPRPTPDLDSLEMQPVLSMCLTQLFIQTGKTNRSHVELTTAESSEATVHVMKVLSN